MSMFRSAAEISSDESSSEDSELQDPRNVAQDSGKGKMAEQNPKDSGSQADTLSFDDVSEFSHDALDVNIERHANVMTAALLEFYCQSRAADILNAQQGSSRTFTRQSPEVQYLGKKLYKYKSHFLSSHGVLADGIDKEEWGSTRQSYRDNLDLLGLSALDELNLSEPHKQPPHIGTTEELALVPGSKLNKHESGDNAQFWLARQGALGFRKQLPPTNKPDMFDNIPNGAKGLPNSFVPLFGSSPVGVPLFNAPVAQPYNHLSRYSVEFSELKVLGRGSFGEVYHVKNHIDGQDYAVKKIPLSQRRLDQLQYGGQIHLETIMKEIRTLARLEHANIVRYYGAWVEQAHVSNPAAAAQRSPHLKYERTQVGMPSQASTNEPSMGIVFEHSESSAVEYLPSLDEQGFSNGIQRWESRATTSSHISKKSSGRDQKDEDDDIESIPRNFDKPSYGHTSTFGATDGDIFTDGLSQDQSKLQVQRQARVAHQPPAVILHIQMSLHPISLGSYLNQQAATKDEGGDYISRKHCFHLLPSVRLMQDIVSGVEYLHAQGIVHRDLKPANIFLSTPENSLLNTCASCSSEHGTPRHFCRPRIGDFGLVADISHLNETSSDETVTPYREGPPIQRVVGTEFYRPPADAVENHGAAYFDTYRIDEKLDVYALGVILFELVYRLNTKMERQLVLNDLTHGSKDNPTEHTLFPRDFSYKVDRGGTMLDNGTTVAEALMTCIRGMLVPQSQARWSCRDITEHLRRIEAAVIA
ncbi:hypothetical protein N7510_007790 [Penicillium lagena]|uniref:uncharacterized protein n=1 Tax=Penicillium lagena TaxID=94218 RepID=UPI00253F6EB1|nr:uncharacterized protein N7510_007790 [Penicillium lagena]KAJ5611071.1 hypothetical protein N7510_007790 [Penicillium lagena]